MIRPYPLDVFSLTSFDGTAGMARIPFPPNIIEEDHAILFLIADVGFREMLLIAFRIFSFFITKTILSTVVLSLMSCNWMGYVLYIIIMKLHNFRLVDALQVVCAFIVASQS